MGTGMGLAAGKISWPRRGVENTMAWGGHKMVGQKAGHILKDLSADLHGEEEEGKGDVRKAERHPWEEHRFWSQEDLASIPDTLTYLFFQVIYHCFLAPSLLVTMANSQICNEKPNR